MQAIVRMRRVVLCAVGVLASASVLAAEPFAAPGSAESSIPASPGGGLVQVTFSLLLVLAAIFAAAWAMRRLRGFGRLAPGTIEIIADVALGQKERAVLVQVGKQQLLLGVAAGGVTTLHVLEEPVSVPPRSPLLGKDAAEAGAGKLQTHGEQFKAILKRSLGI